MFMWSHRSVFLTLLVICLGILTACEEDAVKPISDIKAAPRAVSISVSTPKVGFVANKSSGPRYIDVSVHNGSVDRVDIDTMGDNSLDWLSVSSVKAPNGFTLTLTVTSAKMSAGDYEANLEITGMTPNGTRTKPATLTVTLEVPGSAEGAIARGYRDKILHFGQEIILNGANLAWSQDSDNWYNNEVGDVDEEGNPRTNIPAFRNHFQTIANAGGNSARIWLHTGTQTTPVYGSDGIVTNLSRDLTNEQVAGQLELILDTAWEEGVLVTFSIFSFNMICEFYTPDAAKLMLEEEYQSYIDNALTPMVEGVKYHPALLAWEVFNEPEGMSQTDYFCPSATTIATETVQNVVNRTAAAIHKIDPHVKVTTSTHTDLFDYYSNATLTSIPGADPTGILDFYELHWYNTGWQVSPHIVPASDFNADRPIIIGEYDLEDNGAGGPDAQSSARLLLENGYQGVWPWSLSTGNVAAIESAITEAAPLSTRIDKAAIEACIARGPLQCYVN